MPRKWTTENLGDARRRHEAGESLGHIAPTIGIHPEVLRKAFHEFGWPVAPHQQSLQRGNDARYRALYDRYLAGESSTAIAADAGVNFSNLLGAWKRRGWPVRSGSEAAHLLYTQRPPEFRQTITAAAHEAVRGRDQSFEHRCRIALGKERTRAHQSEGERLLLDMLPIDAIPVRAIGPYNVDIAFHSIAVEVYGGAWHGGGRAAARWPERVRYILDQGWSVLVIWVEQPRHPLTVAAAEYIIALANVTGPDPAATRQYRVIRGTGEEIIRGCAKDDHFPLKPPRERRLNIRCEHHLATD